ncbi:MAG TPA: cohesin domain-containing protein [Dehalococcoidia bacterium]|nr:cohesin domain-containing protein [Dehalococcoidia bacterium]
MIRGFVSTLVVAVAALLAALMASSPVMADVGEVGIDADPSGNEAGSLGDVQNCIGVSVGDSFDIDVYVKDIDDLIAFRAFVQYDPAVLEVSDRDTEFFLTTADETGVLDQSDTVPDSDGQYELQAVNASDSSAGASGDGVLGRVTFTAVGTGFSTIDLTPVDLNTDGVIDRGIYFADFEGDNPGDEDGDTYYDGTLRGAVVAAGESCDDAPDAPGSQEDDNGISLWIIIAAVVAGIVVVAGAGAFLVQRRKAPAS